MRDHFVPQFRLRHFANADGKLAVFDKQTDSVLHGMEPQSIGFSQGFYVYRDNQGLAATADGVLRKLESNGAPVLARIVQSQRLGGLSSEQWESLLGYFSAEILRSPWAKGMLARTGQALKAASCGCPPGSDLDTLSNTTDDESAATVFEMIRTERPALLKILRDCWPVLMHAPQGHQFILGDHCVAMQTLDNVNGSPGVPRLYVIPISPSLTLMLIPPGCGLPDPRPSGTLFNAQMDPSPRREATPAGCDRWNYLQIKFAERYLFAGSRELLDPVKSLIAKDPSLRAGLRPMVRSHNPKAIAQ